MYPIFYAIMNPNQILILNAKFNEVAEIESKFKIIVHNILLNNKLHNPNVYYFKYYMFIYFIN